MTDTITIARVFIADGTFADFRLGDMSWEAFIHQLVVNNAAVSDEVWINRQAVTKIVKIEAAEGINAPNVLKLAEPKGTA